MQDPDKQGEEITTPTEEEQEAVTGGSDRNRVPHQTPLPDTQISPEKLHRHVRPKWNPGGPPETF